MLRVLVSHHLEDRYREIIIEVLGGRGRLLFLQDLHENRREAAVEGAEIIMAWNPAKEFLPDEFSSMRRLSLLQLITAGAEHIPFRSVPEQAQIACNPGAFAAAMAEHILGMLLSLAKRLCPNNAGLARGDFDQTTRSRIIRGLSCGVLGFGGIGQAAAALLRAVGLKILAVNTSGKTTEPVEFAGTLDDLEYVLENSDVLLVSLPLTLRTRGLIGKRELARMKPDAIIINVARGAIIDEEALYDHLVQNSDFCAAIDTWWIEPSMGGVFMVNFPFFKLPNFLGSPHNSAIAPGVMSEAMRAAAENVVRFIEGGTIRGEINRKDYI